MEQLGGQQDHRLELVRKLAYKTSPARPLHILLDIQNIYPERFSFFNLMW